MKKHCAAIKASYMKQANCIRIHYNPKFRFRSLTSIKVYIRQVTDQFMGRPS